MSNVDVTIWPDADAVPTGHVNPGRARPFGVLKLLGFGGDASIQFMTLVSPADQAKYLRALAKVANEVADELDPQDGAES